MARARNIKPKFFTNEELVELPFSTRLLFIGLWTISDRAGRLEDKPKRIKMELFPADSLDIDEALNELQSSKFLLRYEHDGMRYIQILAFSKHQNPHKDEKASIIPAPFLHGICIMQEPQLNGCNPAISLIPDSLIPDSLPLIPETPSAGAEEIVTPNCEQGFESAWKAYPPRTGASKADSLKAWKARIKAGAIPEQILAGVVRYAEYVRAKGTEDNFIKQPTTFFGPGKHYESNWDIPANARGSPGNSQLGIAGQATAAAAKQWMEEADASE